MPATAVVAMTPIPPTMHVHKTAVALARKLMVPHMPTCVLRHKNTNGGLPGFPHNLFWKPDHVKVLLIMSTTLKLSGLCSTCAHRIAPRPCCSWFLVRRA